MRRFPMLEVLDQEALTKISFVDGPVPSSSSNTHGQIGPANFPLDMGPSFITGVDGSVISSFLSRYVPVPSPHWAHSHRSVKAFSLFSTLKDLPWWTFTIPRRLSRIPHSLRFLPVPASKAGIPRRPCRTNASLNGAIGYITRQAVPVTYDSCQTLRRTVSKRNYGVFIRGPSKSLRRCLTFLSRIMMWLAGRGSSV